ncbi:hypothetical protein PG911_08175 [Tenacibaculum ovolyticum]|uniref:hypothetical protein n=1 Tax=Tenacibaculum ovolyticum TaxID=104270 RepID=UPI0022F40304|nr:hypothetical protein [Tenacibaculum ovolyticum]WBX78219.1 hypothetical protein PG911_08175 [Tenacibaculum ovolyticum]
MIMKPFLIISLLISLNTSCKQREPNNISSIQTKSSEKEILKVKKHEKKLSNSTYFDIKNCKIGIINDSDGYSNARKFQDTSSEIVFKIVENEYFFYVPIENSNWSMIKNLGQQIAYIHNSRIKEINNQNLLNVNISFYDEIKGDYKEKDTIIKISSFNKNSPFLIKEFNYNHYKVLNKVKDKISLANDLDTLIMSTEKFNSSFHKVIYREGNYIETVDGNKVFGVELGIPKNEIKSIKISFDDYSFYLRKEEYNYLLEPVLDRVKVYKMKKKDEILIYMSNGDGAGAYSAVFIMKKDKIIKKVVYREF